MKLMQIKNYSFAILALLCMPLKAAEKTTAINDFKQNLNVIFAKPNAEQMTAKIAAAEYRLKLNEYLLAADHDFAQIMSLASTLSGIRQSKMLAELHQNTAQLESLEQINYKPFADVLNEMIASKSTSPEALNIMTKVCYDVAISQWCQTNQLLDKRMLADSENLQSYLRPLAIASQLNDNKLMGQLIHLMSISKYSHTPLKLTDTMNGLIEKFLSANPAPMEMIQNQTQEYQQMTGISAEMKTKLSEVIPAYMPTIIKTSYQFLTDMPPYKPLLNYCKSNLSAIKACRDIAETMIQKSNTMIDKGLGHAVLIASYEAENNQDGVIAAQKLNDQFRSGYECIRQLSQAKYFIDDYFDPDYQKIHTDAVDEYEKLILLADRQYKKAVAAGDQSATDPESCFITE